MPPAAVFFCHTSQGHFRVVLAGVARPGCLQPSSDCPHLQKSFRDWLAGASLRLQHPQAQGKKAVLTHRPQETPAPTPALPSLCFARSTWAFTLPSKIHPVRTPLILLLWALLQGQSKMCSSSPSAHSSPNYPTAFPSNIPKPPDTFYLQNTEQLWLYGLCTSERVFFHLAC